MRRFLSEALRDQSGATAVYVSLLGATLIGVGALAIDASRVATAQTGLQSAADAAALAAARELDRKVDDPSTPGDQSAMGRARAAAVQALNNAVTFGSEPYAVVEATDCAVAAPGRACVRFLKDLPLDDDAPIPPEMTATGDKDARYVQVTVGAQKIEGLFAGAIGAVANVDLDASAVAGADKVICNAPPLFMCNPSEPVGNVDPDYPIDNAALRGKMLMAFSQGGAVLPGNFGLVCPAGTEDDPNCGAGEFAQALASVSGACVRHDGMVTAPGGKIGPMETGFNVRFDIWDSSSAAWRADEYYAPAVNVTQGGGSIVDKGNSCTRDRNVPANKAAMGAPRDTCFATGTCPEPNIGDGAWDRASYFATNHNRDVGSQGFPSDLGSAPTRYEVYRWEIENERIVAPGQPVYGATGTTTAEQGKVATGGLQQCYRGSVKADAFTYLPSRKVTKDILNDRRVLSAAVVNCQALDAAGGDTGRFALRSPQFAALFLTEPVRQTSNKSEIWVEMIGKIDEAEMEILTHDLVQIFRR